MPYQPKSAQPYMPKSAQPVVDEPSITSPSPSGPQDNPLISLLRGLGGSGIADIAGVAQEPGRLARKATNSYGTGVPVEENPFISGAQKEGFQKNPVQEVGVSGLRDLLSSLLVGGATMGGAGVAPYLTKQGVAGLSTKAAEKGQEVPWQKVVERATQAVTKFGNPNTDMELRDTLKSLLLRIKPTDYLGQESISSPELLNTRRQMLAREGTGILNFLKGNGDLESKVSGAVRGGLSDLLHEAAPATKLPDTLYKLYSKGGPLGGDIPTLAIKYGLGIPLLRKLLGPLGGAIGKSLQ